MDRCRCQGVRDAKESVSCEVGCEQRASCRLVVVPAGAGMVASMGVCLQGMSSCDESLSGSSGGIPVSRVYSSGSSRLKRPSVCSVRSCRSMACWNKTKVHVAGVPLSSIRIDCTMLRHSMVGCDDVCSCSRSIKSTACAFSVRE